MGLGVRRCTNEILESALHEVQCSRDPYDSEASHANSLEEATVSDFRASRSDSDLNRLNSTDQQDQERVQSTALVDSLASAVLCRRNIHDSQIVQSSGISPRVPTSISVPNLSPDLPIRAQVLLKPTNSSGRTKYFIDKIDIQQFEIPLLELNEEKLLNEIIVNGEFKSQIFNARVEQLLNNISFVNHNSNPLENEDEYNLFTPVFDVKEVDNNNAIEEHELAGLLLQPSLVARAIQSSFYDVAYGIKIYHKSNDGDIAKLLQHIDETPKGFVLADEENSHSTPLIIYRAGKVLHLLNFDSIGRTTDTFSDMVSALSNSRQFEEFKVKLPKDMRQTDGITCNVEAAELIKDILVYCQNEDILPHELFVNRESEDISWIDSLDISELDKYAIDANFYEFPSQFLKTTQNRYFLTENNYDPDTIDHLDNTKTHTIGEHRKKYSPLVLSTIKAPRADGKFTVDQSMIERNIFMKVKALLNALEVAKLSHVYESIPTAFDKIKRYYAF